MQRNLHYEIEQCEETPAKGAKRTKKQIQERRSKWIRALSLLTFFAIWQIFCMINVQYKFFNPVFLPSPFDVLQTLYRYLLNGTLFTHLGASLLRTLAGFAIGVAVALVLGILITHSKVFDNIVTPILNMISPIPVFAFLPMFIIWFGIGESSKITLVAYATFMPLLAYTIDGFRNTNPLHIRSAISLGASKAQIFTKVVFKSALPNIFTGMKVSLGLTFSALVVAEMMGASSGLGYIIVDARNWFKMQDMFMAAALIGIEYTVFYGVITAIEKLIFKWRRDGLSGALEN